MGQVRDAATGQLAAYKLRRPRSRRACKRTWAATAGTRAGLRVGRGGGTGLLLDPVERARGRQSLWSERGAL